MEIYVIRHTEVDVEKGSCYGQSDVALSNDYLQHIDQVKSKLPSEFDQVFSSPLKRCRILAQHITAAKIEYHNSLMEMHFGTWENQLWDNINALQLQEWMDDFVYAKTPEGESLELLYKRVSLFIDELRGHKARRIALVTHAGVVRCIWAYLLDIPLENIFKIPINYGEGMVFKLGGTKELDQIVKMVF